MATDVVIRVRSHPRKGGARVEIEETFPAGYPKAAREDASSFWDDALRRLRRLANRIRARQRSPRQAVIVIHGIGEQQPGETLARFLEGAFGDDAENLRWVKPDQRSRLFELSKATLKATPGQARPRTDIYEFYWADLIQDTKLGHVTSWLRQLLLRRQAPGRLGDLRTEIRQRVLGFIFWLAAAVALFWWLAPPRLFSIPPALALGALGVAAVAGLIAWHFVRDEIVLNTIGDAPRYLRPLPANIQRRQAIREAGVDLLEALHADGDLDRIVIVGHSLGSVVAYDIITHYWIRKHRKHLRLARLQNATSGIGRALGRVDEKDLERARELQHAAWLATRANSQPWLVSDLVTAGSPLSLADALMAGTPAGFERAKTNRILPTCPPEPELRGKDLYASFDRPYTDRFGGRDKLISLFHHAAPFAVTRWTNLHFDSGLLKDPIGGPLRQLFGAWILDVHLEDPKGRSLFLHSDYFHPTGSEDIDPHIRALRDALDLDCGGRLLTAMKSHSPLLYLPK